MSSSSSSLIDKYNNSNNALKLQLANIDNELLELDNQRNELNNQRNGILERLAFNEVNLQNITQQDTPSLGYLSNELIKIIVSYMDAYKQEILFDVNKHYRKYKMMTCYYKFDKKRSYEYLINHNGMRDKIERSLANPSQQISLTFANKSILDVSVLANVHSLTLRKCNGLKDVSSLSKLSYIDLTGTRGITDISALVNVETLKLVDMNKKIGSLPSNLNVKHLTIQMPTLNNIESLSNCISLNILGNHFPESSLSKLCCLAHVQDLSLANVNFSTSIDGWNNKKLALSNVSHLEEIKNLKDMDSLRVSASGHLKEIKGIDNVKEITIERCNMYKEIVDIRNVDSMTLSSMPTLTSLANLTNVTNVDISSCGALLDLRAILHPLANVQKLTINLLNIVDLDVKGRVPDVSLTRCNMVVNVSGLAACQKVSISHCTAVTDVSSLGRVKELRLDYRDYDYNFNDIYKRLQGIDALGNVDVLVLAGVNLASHDVRCYSNVKMLTLLNCSNLNMPLATLRLLQAGREDSCFDVRSCKFDAQNEIDIQARHLNTELEESEIKFYFQLNSAKYPVKKIAPGPIKKRAQVPVDEDDFGEYGLPTAPHRPTNSMRRFIDDSDDDDNDELMTIPHSSKRNASTAKSTGARTESSITLLPETDTSWVCNECTYHGNVSGNDYCDMCGYRQIIRPKRVRSDSADS